MDYYKLLNVDRYASQDQIRRAFKKRALLYHPDRLHNKTDEEKVQAELMFKQVSHAHDILSDNPTRRQYDRECARQELDQARSNNNTNNNNTSNNNINSTSPAANR